MANVTSSQLKTHFRDYSKEEVVREVMELSRTFPGVQEFYQSKLIKGGTAELRERYKRVIQNEFFPERGFGRARLSVARKAVTDFRRISEDVHSIADMLIHYVEVGVAFTREYGDIDEPFYDSMEKMYETAVSFVVKHNVASAYQARFEKMVSDTSDTGWGFHDTLTDLYGRYFPEASLKHV